MTRGWPYMIAAGGTALLVIGMLLWAHYARPKSSTPMKGLGKFYQSWKMPDNRAASCCNDEDCAPSASRLVNGKWEAQRDGEWVSIPEHKIETERDSPDGRSHLCGKRYNVFGKGGVTVFCFIAGSGT
jgi:hypothetical protein